MYHSHIHFFVSIQKLRKLSFIHFIHFSTLTQAFVDTFIRFLIIAIPDFTSFSIITMFSKLILTTALAAAVSAYGTDTQPGKTTRYWDCCKPSCAWEGKAGLTSPVKTCDINNNPLADLAAKSSCEGGESYTCADQSPWVVNDSLAYGFAAVNLASGELSSCCSCYELTFNSGPVAGKKMIVQATNTGADVGANQFDLAIPGGGVGLFNACTKQYNAPPNGWGKQYGGIDDASSCDGFAPAIKAGCQFRFDWFQGADNPTMDWKRVACPKEIVAVSGCSRTDEADLPAVEARAVEAPPVAEIPAVVKAPAPKVNKAPQAPKKPVSGAAAVGPLVPAPASAANDTPEPVQKPSGFSTVARPKPTGASADNAAPTKPT